MYCHPNFDVLTDVVTVDSCPLMLMSGKGSLGSAIMNWVNQGMIT